MELLKECIEKSNRFIVVATPASFSDNISEANRFGNEYEEHKCLMEDRDFPEGSIIEQYKNQKLVIIDKFNK